MRQHSEGLRASMADIPAPKALRAVPRVWSRPVPAVLLGGTLLVLAGAETSCIAGARPAPECRWRQQEITSSTQPVSGGAPQPTRSSPTPEERAVVRE